MSGRLGGSGDSEKLSFDRFPRRVHPLHLRFSCILKLPAPDPIKQTPGHRVAQEESTAALSLDVSKDGEFGASSPDFLSSKNSAYHRNPPTSKTALRSSRFETSENPSMRHVNLP